MPLGEMAEIISKTGLAGLLVVGVLYVIHRALTLWITKWFDKVVPVQERGVQAIQDLASTAREYLEVQRDTNQKFEVGISVLGGRVRKLEERNASGQPA